MEKFVWDGSVSQRTVLEIIGRMKKNFDAENSKKAENPEEAQKKRENLTKFANFLQKISILNEEEILKQPEVQAYCKAWNRYRNGFEEKNENLQKYGRKVRQILGIPFLT